MNLVGRLHGQYVHSRRVRVLSDCLSSFIPENSNVLDVGCGDGLLASLIMERRGDLQLSGMDVLVRNETRIPVTQFNGSQIPFPDKSIDVVMFVDVLHHTDDPMVLLSEAKRVARKALIIKDHLRDGVLAGPTLRFMDLVGNAPHGVVLPYNYWPRKKWDAAFKQLNLKIDLWNGGLQLYAQPMNLIFGRSLHFVTRLQPSTVSVE